MATMGAAATVINRPTSHRSIMAVVWVLLLLLFMAALRPAEALWTCGDCEGGSSLTCPSSLDMQFSVSIYPYNDKPDRSLHLTCDYQTINLNFTMLRGCSFPDVMYVKIDTCPLFNESLGSVLTTIGVNANNVRSLLWAYSHSVENGLKSWHLDNLPNLTSIQMHDNEFTSYPKEFLKKTPLVRKLFVTGNLLNELPSDILNYTPDVVEVDLGNNKLLSVPDNMLVNVPSLQILKLWTNQFTSIPANFLANNKALTKVDLSVNNLVSIEPGLFANLKNLTNVNLRWNQLETVPESAFSGCINLTSVTLTRNKLSYLPPKLFQDTSLQILNLGYNKLTNITGVLRNLKTLQNVTLYKNNLEILDKEMLAGSPNIVRLDVQFNNIKTLSAGIFDSLNKMKLILLNSNSLDELPPGLFKNCLSLIRIFLQENSLSRIPTDTFPNHSDITKLNISSNNLSFDQDEYFNPLNKLTRIEELYLANNKISSIFDDALHIFTSLKILDLRNNSINFLSDRELSFLSRNVTLLLQDNNISNIPAMYSGFTSKSKKFMYVSLAGNPLNCDCVLYSFLTAANLYYNPPTDTKQNYTLIVQDARHVYCSEPENYLNVSLADVDPEKVLCEFNCSDECSCHLRIHDRYLLMDCSNRGLFQPPNLLLENFTDDIRKLKKKLDLSNNDYEEVGFLENSEYNNLIEVNLTNNSIAELNETFLPASLQVMDLSFNNFTTIPESLVNHLNTSGMKLYLGENPWSCNCGLKTFHEFLRNNYELVRDRQRVLCIDGDTPIDELSTEDICSFLYQPTTLASIAAGALIMLFFTVLITAAWYRHKELVKVWLYSHNMCLWAVTEHEIDADKKYDAFISYSYKDEGFVNNILVPGLESGDTKYKVCLHYRDWVPGEYIQDQILSSVKASRRTIVVLSKNFIESVWGQLEFKAAHSQALKDKTNRVIIIVYGEVPSQDELDGELKLYVSINTYLQWGDHKFWEKLRYAMPHAKYVRHKKNKVDKLELVKPAPKADTKTIDE